MGIQTLWDDADKTVIRLNFLPEWTWQDLYSAIDETDALIASVPHRVDVIVDLQGGIKIPGDFMTMAKDILSNPTPRPNEGARVIVGANRFMQMAYSAIQRAFSSQLSGRGVHFESSLDAAREKLTYLRMM